MLPALSGYVFAIASSLMWLSSITPLSSEFGRRMFLMDSCQACRPATPHFDFSDRYFAPQKFARVVFQSPYLGLRIYTLRVIRKVSARFQVSAACLGFISNSH
ncbi:hypothetical protein CPB83DRAFT_854926, partial [Crepidotus variabilis]